MQIRRWIMAIALAFAATTRAAAADAYVNSLTGSGSTCSEVAPCATVAAGIAAVSDGGTVYIKGDPASYDTYAYAENNLLAANAKAITFRPWNVGEKVQIGGDSANPIFWGVASGKALAFVSLKIANANAGAYACAIRATYNGANPAATLTVDGCVLSSGASNGTVLIHRATALSGAGASITNSAGPAVALQAVGYVVPAITLTAGSTLQGRPPTGGSPNGVIALQSGALDDLTLTDSTILTDWSAGLGTSYAIYVLGNLSGGTITDCTIDATGTASESVLGVNTNGVADLTFTGCALSTASGRIAYIQGAGASVSGLRFINCTMVTASTNGVVQVASPASVGTLAFRGGTLATAGVVYVANTGTVSNLMIRDWTCTAPSGGAAYIFNLQQGHDIVSIDGLSLTGATTGALFLIGGENTVLGDPVATTATQRFDVIDSTFVQTGSGHGVLIGRGATRDAHATYMSLPVWSASLGTPALGTMIRPTAMNGWWYVCTVSGAVGASEPPWNTTEGGSTVDGAATWRTMRILFPAGHSRFSRNRVQGSAAGPVLTSKWFNVEITHNLVTSTVTGATGILLKGARENLIAHNTVYMPDGTGLNTYSNYAGDAIYGPVYNCTIRDNIFATDSTTYWAVDIPEGSQINTLCDHNIYWAPRSAAWRFAGYVFDNTPYQEGGIWLTGGVEEENDAHSLVANPVFLSTSPTHALFLVPSIWSRARNAASMPHMSIGAIQQTSGLLPLYLGGKR